MIGTRTISVGSIYTLGAVISAACGVTNCLAQIGTPLRMMHPDSDFIVMAQRASTHTGLVYASDASMTGAEMIELRAMGADPDLIPRETTEVSLTASPFSSFSDSAFSGSSQGYGRSPEPNAYLALLNNTKGFLDSSSGMRFTVGRNTTLNDGNIAGSNSSLPGQGDSVSSMTQREGEYNFYDMMVEWQAASSGPVEFSLTSGVTAIEANVSKSVNSGGTSSLYDVEHRVIAVPTIGSAVRWNISPDWSLSGQATTQSINTGSSLIGFNAQTDWKISDRVGLSAGYQILRSEFDLGAVTSELNQEGLFARLQIRF